MTKSKKQNEPDEVIYPHITLRFDRRYIDKCINEERKRKNEIWYFFDNVPMCNQTGSVIWCVDGDPICCYDNVKHSNLLETIKFINTCKLYKNCVGISIKYYDDLLDYI